ncbi:MAG: Cytochrome c-type biogenesis protein CcdA [Candidatus Tokpelaia hoelldobleri]|uniref:Cytochrome c-type biogenesis protein CcdA n=1 Tax=Candidatus Tokpelaia hoelldobleri TaxID=1902579 RepID=A0A1U9JW70_9HYPH|nr:MAG: Cytochrome c-type biogenesis protein CcdA [Candidatus Tokpelaia hoelldoblerii]
MDFSQFGLVFLAGMLSFITPCVFPLVLPYLCYMAGVSVEDFRGGGEKGQKSRVRVALALSSLCFILGFSLVFIALGAGATAIGGLLRRWQDEITVVAGIVIILMGLNFLGVLRLPFLSREARFQANSAPATRLGAFVMGMAFAFGWTPCMGPILAPVMTLAGARETVGEGAALLAVYSFGLGIPFFLAGLFSAGFMWVLSGLRVHLGRIEKIVGILLILAGILFLTGGIQDISYWLNEKFPWLQEFG